MYNVALKWLRLLCNLAATVAKAFKPFVLDSIFENDRSQKRVLIFYICLHIILSAHPIFSIKFLKRGTVIAQIHF